LHEYQPLELNAGQSAPRNCAFAAPSSQSGAPWGSQPLRLSSARAKNSASFGSLPEVSSVSRFSVQAMAARRAGSVSPWQEKPEICSAGYSLRLR